MKHILWYTFWLLLLFAGDRIGGHLLRDKALHSEFRYGKLYRRQAAADLLLVGNSRGLCFYQPYIEEITGRSTCNLSYNGLPMNAARCLVLDFLDLKNFEWDLKPQQMLIDITLCDRDNSSLLPGFLPYISRSKNLDTLIRNQMPKVWWGAQVSHLYRFNHEIYQRSLYYQNRSDKDWLLDREITPEMAARAAQNSYDMEIHPHLIKQLAETVSSARHTAGWEVRLLIGPYFPGFQVKNLDQLKAEVEKATGLPVHDYRNAITDPAAFGDYMHLNKKGSMQYMDLLKKDGFFGL
ncbi:MAG: hypothetical protein J0M29_17025 [Chitinophagales bacterium]|nr:hypothetical protein [Chitinophagales bacterium]